MFVQSLRGDPFRDFNMSVLAAYVRPSSNSEIVKVNLLASNDFEKVHLCSRFSRHLHGLGGWCLWTFCILVQSTENIVGRSWLWCPILRNFVHCVYNFLCIRLHVWLWVCVCFGTETILHLHISKSSAACITWISIECTRMMDGNYRATAATVIYPPPRWLMQVDFIGLCWMLSKGYSSQPCASEWIMILTSIALRSYGSQPYSC